MRQGRGIVFVIATFIVLGAVAWNLRILFLQNNVKFLINQKDLVAAQTRLKQVEGLSPSSARTKFLHLKLGVISGQLTEALKVDRDAGLERDVPEAGYWKAIAFHQLGEDKLAERSARTFLESGSQLPDEASLRIARALANQNIQPIDSGVEERNLMLLQRVEKAVYFLLTAKSYFSAQNLDRANVAFRRAFVLGSSNPTGLEDGVRAAAMSSLVQQGALLLTRCAKEVPDHLYEEFQKNLLRYQSTTLSLDTYGGSGKSGKQQLAHALAWISQLYLQGDIPTRKFQVLRTLADLQAEYPYDDVLKLRLAEILEILDRNQEAHAIYKGLNDESPSLATSLRMWNLEKLSDDEITSRIKQVTSTLDPVRVYEPGNFGGERASNSNFASYAATDVCRFNVSVVTKQDYTVTLIARGYELNKGWPLVQMKLGEDSDAHYINSSTWEIYSHSVLLDKGSHAVEIRYTNAGDKRTSASALLNFDLKAVYVTLSDASRK